MKKREENEDVRIETEKEADNGGGEVEIEEVEAQTEKKVARIRAELAACERERKEYLDGWQRAKADYVNALRRFGEEVKNAEILGRVASVKALLPALDALERAQSGAELPEGFAAIAKQLHSAFAALGIEPVGAPGELFDPALHEAVESDPATSNEEDNTVRSVFQTGWKIGALIVRPAKVRVAHLKT